MKTFTLLFLALLFAAPSGYSQALTADAGPDKAWCTGWFPNNIDSPVLGGTIPASGGTAPYTFSWSIVGSSSPSYYLDDPQLPHPTFIRNAGVDSIQAVLKVVDASGSTVYDTTTIYFQQMPCTLANEPPIIKHPADTVTLRWLWSGCISNFPPYHDYRWSPTAYLVDSTVEFARCFTPVTQTYTLYKKDSIGCPMMNTIEVKVVPVSVSKVSEEPVSLQLNPVLRSLAIQGLSAGRIQLTDLSGRRVWEEDFSGNTALQLPASLPSGMYAALVFDVKGQPILRQKLTLP